MAPIVAAFSGENQQSMYLGVWRFNARKPALLLGDGEKCASKVSKSGLELNNICGSPFIEPEPGVAESYERKTLLALARVRNAELKGIAKMCAARVRLK